MWITSHRKRHVVELAKKRAVWLVASTLLVAPLSTPLDVSAVMSRLVIAGYGPEFPVMQELARAYEKSHPGIAIDFEWEPTVRAVERVKNGAAQIAVTDQSDASLKAVPVAWDEIAVIVNFTSPVTELTNEQVRRLFSGQITRWSELDGADQRVDLVLRGKEDNLTAGFIASLGLAGPITGTGPSVRSDQQPLQLVSGRAAAVSYISLSAALKAQEDGIPIRILTIDRVEPGEPTVSSGVYLLRRPVLLLTASQRDQELTDCFLSFVQSADGQLFIRTMFTPLGPSKSAPLPANIKQNPGIRRTS